VSGATTGIAGKPIERQVYAGVQMTPKSTYDTDIGIITGDISDLQGEPITTWDDPSVLTNARKWVDSPDATIDLSTPGEIAVLVPGASAPAAGAGAGVYELSFFDYSSAQEPLKNIPSAFTEISSRLRRAALLAGMGTMRLVANVVDLAGGSEKVRIGYAAAGGSSFTDPGTGADLPLNRLGVVRSDWMAVPGGMAADVDVSPHVLGGDGTRRARLTSLKLQCSPTTRTGGITPPIGGGGGATDFHYDAQNMGSSSTRPRREHVGGLRSAGRGARRASVRRLVAGTLRHGPDERLPGCSLRNTGRQLPRLSHPRRLRADGGRSVGRHSRACGRSALALRVGIERHAAERADRRQRHHVRSLRVERAAELRHRGRRRSHAAVHLPGAGEQRGWTAWVNGTQVFTTATNTATWGVSEFGHWLLGGAFSTQFDGWFGELHLIGSWVPVHRCRRVQARAAQIEVGDPVSLVNDLEIIKDGALGDMYYRSASGLLVPVGGTRGNGNVITDQTSGVPVWAPPPATGATPAEELITETVLGGTSSNVSFTSIVGTYRDLRVVVRGRGDKAATFVEVRLRVNGDTGANYDFESIIFNNATSTSGATAATTFGFLGWIEASTSPASAGSSCEVRLYDYRGTTFQKHLSTTGAVKTGSAVGNFFSHRGDIWWRSTSAITQIDVFPDSGNFIAGTVVTLYGRH
jgi:hypothetical protein